MELLYDIYIAVLLFYLLVIQVTLEVIFGVFEELLCKCCS